MKVRELIEKLTKLDQSLQVVMYCEDEGLLKENRGFVLFSPEEVNVSHAETVRLDDQTPYMKFERSEASRDVALINITSDF